MKLFKNLFFGGIFAANFIALIVQVNTPNWIKITLLFCFVATFYLFATRCSWGRKLLNALILKF